MKILIYFISITSLYAQCGFLSGTVTQVGGSKPLVAILIAKTAQGKVKIGKTSEMGLFSVEIPCAASDIIIESKGYQALTIPLHNDTKGNADYFVALKLLPIGKQTSDEPYAQSEQTHLILKDSTASASRVVRRIIVEDALSGETLPANVCLYYTHKQTRECYDLVKSNPGIEVALPENDIVAMEVKLSGYQSYNGNIILDQVLDSTRTYILKLNRQQTILSVNIINPHAGSQGWLREGNRAPMVMQKINDGHYYAEASPGRSYKFELADQNQDVKLSVAIAALKAGLTLKSFKIPLSDSLKRENDIPAIHYTVTNRTLYFPQSDYKLPAESRSYLDSLAAWILANKDKKLEISGHTDNVGNPSINLTLSEYRVRVISKYLISKGVQESAIKAKGMGSKHPVAPNDTEKNRKKNRRVEVQIIDLQDKKY